MQQLLPKEPNRRLQGAVDTVALGGLLDFLWAALHAHAGPASQRLCGLTE